MILFCGYLDCDLTPRLLYHHTTSEQQHFSTQNFFFPFALSIVATKVTFLKNFFHQLICLPWAIGLENIHTQAAKRYQYCQNLAQTIYNFCVGAHLFLSRYTSCNVLKIILLHLGAKSIYASFVFDPPVNDPHF